MCEGRPEQSDDEPYTYTPLHTGRIRVAHVLPGQPHSDIRLTFDTLSLGQKVTTHLEYEALSYVWGSEESPKTVHVVADGKGWTLKVTRNCHEALNWLRLAGSTRILWIDAICINQADMEERGNQVQMMTEVYSQAARVLVWLGPPSGNSNLAMAWLTQVSTYVAYDEQRDDIVAITDGGESQWAQHEGSAPLSIEQISALADFLSRPWFERLWIWQEVHKGDKRAVLYCGYNTISWSKFRAAILALQFKTIGPTPTSGTLGWRLNFVMTLCKRSKFSQVEQLEAMRISYCKDPSDRIYTAQALATWQDLYVKPDYTYAYPKVYLTWAKAYIRHRKDLDLLSHLAPLDESSPMPSWVPDWSRKRGHTQSRFHGMAHGRAQSAIVSITDQELKVKGVLVSAIQTTLDSTIPVSATTFTARLRGLSQIIKEATLKLDIPDLLPRLCRLFRCGLPTDQIEAAERRRFFNEEVVAVLADIAENGLGNISESQQDHLFILAEFCVGRSISMDKDNRLILGPVCRAQDVVAVLLGCEYPLLLRPSTNETYQVLGHAYVEGLMYGEAILGPVPSTHRYLWKVFGTTHAPAFEVARTGDVVYRDPRLPPLSAEWVEGYQRGQTWNVWYKHRGTGEERSAFGAHPGCDVEALEGRGVRLQDVVLV